MPDSSPHSVLDDQILVRGSLRAGKWSQEAEDAFNRLVEQLEVAEKLLQSERVQSQIAKDAERLADRRYFDTLEQLEALNLQNERLGTDFVDLQEKLETAQRERDLIGAALGEPCAECGHIDWRSDGYADAAVADVERRLEIVRRMARYGPGSDTTPQQMLDTIGMYIERHKDDPETYPEACPFCGCLTHRPFDASPDSDAPDGAVLCDNCGKGWVLNPMGASS